MRESYSFRIENEGGWVRSCHVPLPDAGNLYEAVDQALGNRLSRMDLEANRFTTVVVYRKRGPFRRRIFQVTLKGEL